MILTLTLIGLAVLVGLLLLIVIPAVISQDEIDYSSDDEIY